MLKAYTSISQEVIPEENGTFDVHIVCLKSKASATLKFSASTI
jgi:hypothetical protein